MWVMRLSPSEASSPSSTPSSMASSPTGEQGCLLAPSGLTVHKALASLLSHTAGWPEAPQGRLGAPGSQQRLAPPGQQMSQGMHLNPAGLAFCLVS